MDRKIGNRKVKWRKGVLWFLSSVTLLALLYSFTFSDNTQTLRVDGERIRVAKVEMGSFSDYISITGKLMPIRTIYLDALVGGRVEEIYLEDGDLVDSGGEILRLSNSDLKMEIMNREANLADNLNNLRNTRISMDQRGINIERELLEIEYQLSEERREFNQVDQLYRGGKVSQNSYEESLNRVNYLTKKRELIRENQIQDSIFRSIQLKQLKLSVDRMEENFKVVRQKLDDLNLKAPIKGQLSSIDVELGEAVVVGERLGKIDDLSSYKVRAEIDQFYISKIDEDLSGEFQFDGKSSKLRVRKIYKEVKDGKFIVDLNFSDTIPNNIRLGQSFQVKLELGDPQNSIIVPKGSFYHNSGGSWIYVMDRSGEFAMKKEIMISRENPEYYEVVDGLDVGDEVIISSYDSFGESDKLIFSNRE